MKKIICWAALVLALCLPVCALAATEPNTRTIEDTTTYEGETIQITIDQWCYAFNRTSLRFFVANVYVDDPAQLQTAFAGEEYSKSNSEATSAKMCIRDRAGLIGFVYDKETHLPPVGNFDTIIVLGAQVKADGTPSVALERRLTAALEEYQKQPMLMIVCGAQGSDEPRAEGDVMRDWLIEHGVAASDIEAETGSFNTRQNLGYAQSIMDDRGLTEALIVTSDYHVPRALAPVSYTHLDVYKRQG